MYIDKTDFWDDNYYNHPPLTDRMIKIAEKTLGVQLPKLLIELLEIQNGGYTKGFAFPMNERTAWADDHVPLSEMFGIVINKSIKSGQNILDTNYMIREWGLPERQVLLSGDGHWWITLDYREGEGPSVRWIDLECDEDILIAQSFDDFIKGLVYEDKFAEE